MDIDTVNSSLFTSNALPEHQAPQKIKSRLFPRASKSSDSSLSHAQGLNFDNRWSVNPLQNKLGNSISLGD